MINNLRRIRREKDVTQEKLAEAIGATQTQVCFWERNVRLPNIGFVLKMARFLQCEPTDLYQLEKGDDDL